jgi:proteasome accessory factor C
MVPWIADREDPTISEIAGAFGVSEETVLSDLELLPFCGLPPYTPDRLIEATILDDGSVSIRFAEYLSRPLRLTPAEGFALLTAGRALLAVPGSDPKGPLATALEKLETALGAREVMEVDLGEGGHIDAIREAADRRERIEIDYYSFGRDAMTSRTVDPYRLVTLEGAWYLAAYCHQAQDDRLFRVDRVRTVRSTGEAFEPRPPAAGDTDTPFSPAPEHARVTLTLPASAAWVPEAYPTESVEHLKGGRLRVVLVVAARPWLERLLLRVGPEAKVIAPRAWKDLGAQAARRVLARYAP